MLDLQNREREGNWIQTFKGGQFFPIDPRVDEIDIEDIAHSLSNVCRYAGHCIDFYSVAEHSYLLSYHVSKENALWALLHDASEAYLVDVPRPIKPYLPGYFDIEKKLQSVIAIKYNLPDIIPLEVMDADKVILEDERQQNMMTSKCVWNTTDGRSLGVKLNFWSPKQAEAFFLLRFKELTSKGNS